MMELTGGQARLAREIFQWLDESNPATVEIDTYTQEVVKHTNTALLGIPLMAPDEFFAKKRKYFVGIQAEAFLQKLSEMKQLRYIDALRRYNTNSVFQQIQTKEQVTLPAVPADIQAWATDYMSVWEGVLTVLSFEDYQRRLQYLTSFQKIPATHDNLENLRASLVAMLDVIRDRYNRDLEASNEQLNTERVGLSLVPFFPHEFIENALKDSDEPEKRRLFEDLHQVSDLLLNIEDQDPADAPMLLRELVKADKERDVLASMESLRNRTYPTTSPTQQYFNLFERVFTIENVEQKNIMQMLRTEGAQFGTSPQFIAALYAYVRKSPLINELLTPYDVDFILTELARLPAESEIPVFLEQEQIGVKTAERQLFFMPLLNELFAVTHTYREE